MATVFCTQCGQLNSAGQAACLYCDTALPDLRDGSADYAAPPNRPYFANDPGGPAFPTPPEVPPTVAYQQPPAPEPMIQGGSAFDQAGMDTFQQMQQDPNAAQGPPPGLPGGQY